MTELLHELVRHSRDRHGARPALADRAGVLSYGELDALVDQVAAGFAGLGIARHDRVAVFSPKRLEVVAAMFGASRAF